jgi:hypothetical protein
MEFFCDYASLPEKLAKFVASLTDKEPTSDAEHCLEIDDLFRGQTKAFAPGFAHRYKLKLQKANED